MAGRLTIAPASERPGAVAAIASMLSTEWHHLYPDWTAAAARAELLEEGEAGAPPRTWLAFGDDPAVAIGSISLVPDDEVDIVIDGVRPGPWVANLFVVPERRGLGVASALVGTALDHVDRHELGPLWLVTETAPQFHVRFGWVEVAEVPVNGVPNTLMRRG